MFIPCFATFSSYAFTTSTSTFQKSFSSEGGEGYEIPMDRKM
jgi:hypothetical protein